MLIKTNKKKSVFSKAQHVEKFSLSLDPEYIEKIEIFDEEIGNAKKNEKHIILVKVPIDAHHSTSIEKTLSSKNKIEVLSKFGFQLPVMMQSFLWTFLVPVFRPPILMNYFVVRPFEERW